MRALSPLSLFLVVAAVLAPPGRTQDPAVEAARIEFFEARVRPVLVEHCYRCHSSAGEARGGLALDHRAGLRAPSRSGTAVVPGDLQRSLLPRVVRHEIEGLEMPRDGPRLDDGALADLERWIHEGAADPRDAPPTRHELEALTSWEATLARRADWWSLQPIRSHEPPPAGAWSDHPVDRFVAREHERLGLARAGPADRRTLIRRLAYALTGLPPTPAEIAEFLADGRPDATERLVDRLLASPRYGERWARHWMDLVRYADSHGSEGDPAIPGAYRYRDYLIRAFNADVPYDQLVREHVAGDLLAEPRVDAERGIDESATGTAHWRFVFHGFAPTDALDEKVRFVDDQINVFGKTFLAQTIACARCHDHKFDAISQADYYALFGILASCRPGVLDVNVPALQERHRARLAELKGELRGSLAAAWAEASTGLADSLGSLAEEARSPEHPLHLLRDVDRRMESGEPFEDAWRAAAAAALEPTADEPPPARRWDLADARGTEEWYPEGNGLLELPAAPGAFAVEPEGPRVLKGIYPAGVYTHLLSTRHRGVLQSARFDLDGEFELWFRALGGGGARLRYVVQDYPRAGTVYPITQLADGGWSWQQLDLSYWDGDSVHLELSTGRDTPVEVRGGDRSWFGVRDLVLRPRGAGPPAEQPSPLGRALAAAEPASRAELAETAARLVRSAVDAWARNAATDAEALLLDACLRAGLLPNTVEALPAVAELVRAYRELEGRVPLPTRVPGLIEADAADWPLYERGDHRRPGRPVPRRFLEVLDPEPFSPAASGRLELAEDLLRADNPLTARVIVNRIWHHLFGRGIVATPDNFGRLGSEPSHPELLDYLASRMVARGWSIRDTIRFLVTSKTWQLDSSPPPGAREVDPENVWLTHARVRRLDAEALRDSLFAVAGELDERMYGPGFGANSGAPRRGVYVEVRRNALDAFLQAFDAPVPFATAGARPATNVPAQSLALLNGPLARDLASRWGSEVLADGQHGSDAARLARMFESATGRVPADIELVALQDYAADCRGAFAAGAERRAVLALQIAEGEDALHAILEPARRELLARREEGGAPAGPAPLARWDFREGLEDTAGELHGIPHGTARLAEGGLLLDGEGHVATPPIGRELRAKTLEAWVRLADLDQRGGGVVSVQDLGGGVFDAIVYGERIPRRWLAGSDHFRRTEDFGGADEARALDEPVHLAIAYDPDRGIRGYRDGEPYGQPYRKADPVTFRAGESQVLFGLRHGAPSAGRRLRGVLYEARLHDRALSPEELRASAAGAPFVARGDVLAALGEGPRRRVAELEAALALARGELERLGEPAGEEDVWAGVAHALFNLKEFLYVR